MRTLTVLLLLLLLVGCASQSPGPQTMYAGPEAAAAQPQSQFPTCRIGEHVVPQPTTFHFGLFPLTANFYALNLVNQYQSEIEHGSEAQRIAGMMATARGLYEGFLAGKIAGYPGGGALVVVFHGVNGAAMPSAIPLLDHDQNCRAMIPVERMSNASNIFKVRIPLTDAQMWPSLVLDRSVINSHSWVCARSSGFHLAFAPELTKGPYQGLPDIICGLPGNAPGTTHLGEAVARGDHWMRTPILVVP